jgi:AraC-like DNA-binding protein
MANIVRQPWKNFSIQPDVLAHHTAPGWEFREVRYAPAGSWEHVTTRLHIASHLDPLRQRIGGARAPFLLVPPSAAISVPGDHLAGAWEWSGRARHLQISNGFIATALDRDVGPLAIAPRRFARLREPDHSDAIIGHLMQVLALELRRPPRSDSVFLETVVAALIQHALDLSAPSLRTTRKTGGLSPVHLRTVLEAIEDRLTGRPTLLELAALAGVSTRYFCRAFRVSTGYSPHRFILHRRVERARALIAANVSLSEAAIAAGFADHSQMTVTFRKLLHLPPSAFRRETH